MSDQPEQELSYFDKRMALMGVTPEVNKVKLWRTDVADGPTKGQSILVEFPVFWTGDKGINILVYTLDRNKISYSNDELGADGVEVVKRGWKKDFYLTRLEHPTIDAKGKEHKYHIPKGAGTYPFFPPSLIEKYEQKQKIKTLVITEGYFKAFKAGMHGCDIVGLSSITHYKDKEKGTLHEDIIKLIKTCAVENVIWLADGDCNRISMNALEKEEDIYKRPNQFFNTCVQLKRMLDDYEVHKYFAYVDSIRLATPHNTPLPLSRGESQEGNNMPKGFDDLLIEYPGKEKEIIADLVSLSKKPDYFQVTDMSYSTGKIHKMFFLHDINAFVEFHSEQMQLLYKLETGEEAKGEPVLKTKSFVWNGTKYKWNSEKNVCDIEVPGDAKRYFRVGDQYHEKIQIPNKYGELEHTFHRRQKQTIIDDYGKRFVGHVSKFKAFCNVPDHTNYQEVISNCYNMYYPFEHEPQEGGDITYTMNFLKHIFGEEEIKVHHKGRGLIEVTGLELGLDYIQLLYQRPQQVLPILCLVSRENGTGKTTFAKWLKQIFTQNVAIVGNAELANDFNASWAGKVLVICDEAKIDKQVVVERVKSLSTADKIFMNAKGKDHVEIDFFAKFLFLSNNEDNFIYAGEDDVRYWVRKVPVIQELFVGMLEEMKDEIPAFLDFLNKRKLKTEQLHRAWFYPELLKTEALKKVIAFSQSTVEKELREGLRETFFNHGVNEVLMTIDDLKETFFKKKNYENKYLRNVIEDKLKAEVYHVFEYNGEHYTEEQLVAMEKEQGKAIDRGKRINKVRRYSFPRFERMTTMADGITRAETKRVMVQGTGRPYVFRVEKYLTRDELANRFIDPEMAMEVDLLNTGNASWGSAGVGVAAGSSQMSLEVGKDDLPF